MNLVRKHKYPTVDGKPCIEVEVESLRQIFDERDPAPFRQKDLDDDLAEYILLSSQEIGIDRVGKIIIFHSENSGSDLPEADAKFALQRFFAYESEQSRKRIKSILKMGFKALVIGTGFLIVAILAAMSLQNEQGFMASFFKEGMLLLGWVSMWKPVNTFLYDWWPERDLMKVYEKLSQLEIQIIERPESASRTVHSLDVRTKLV